MYTFYETYCEVILYFIHYKILKSLIITRCLTIITVETIVFTKKIYFQGIRRYTMYIYKLNHDFIYHLIHF